MKPPKKTDTQRAAVAHRRLVRPLDFEGQKQRFEEAVGSLDRYGIPHDGIINMLDALSDYIDDEAHGRGGYEAYFKIIQDELDALRSSYLPNVQGDGSPDEKTQPKR